MKNNRKIGAVLIVALLISCAVGAIYTDADSDTEESDAIFWTPLTAILLGVAIGAVGAVSIQYLAGMCEQQQGQMETLTRSNEANAVAQSISAGMAYYNNALENYNQVWTLTDEHWIRQSELAASFSWSADAPYSPYTVLSAAGVYLNSSYMTSNACAQINAHYDSIAERLALWNNTPTYQGKMHVGWAYGLNENLSTTVFGGKLGTTIQVSGQYNKAFVGDGKIFASTAGTMTSPSGAIFNLSAGNNNLTTDSGWEPDVYTFSPGSYLGTILNVNDPQAISVHAGLLMLINGSYKLATYTNDRIIIDGTQYNDLSIRVTPDGGTTQTRSVKVVLSALESLIGTINLTISHASSASAAVYNIFTRAGNACTYLTTLTVPENYNNIEISTAQRECITILAMEQLAHYYNTSGGKIKTGDYNLSNESLQLFCRGDVYDNHGKKLHENVVFSPFYYGSDSTLTRGMNINAQSSIVAIWDTGVNALSSWDKASNINDMSLVAMSPGSKIDVYEMYYDGNPTTSITLDIDNIDIIEPGDIDPTPLPTPTPGKTNWLQIALYILAGCMIIAGFVMGRPLFVLAAVVMILIGALAGDLIWSLVK